ncbi:hypothetical protein LYSHEL_27280 [Lysobacter helvus]|uniref:Uncharacterized protein n=2 Tax=Lysobacteraceae TaxID=32033 RepID=A0ABN6FVG1_9GAMM|nr:MULTISPECIES: hypothetical protein [Lysobacter]BCT93701.1 hypothetical protein LYSCAS_27250 [Lysobacter caseinilyticus]BCT96857.1 hypothetical protein LYSHEL_27280 [Lysobacter helvus]
MREVDGFQVSATAVAIGDGVYRPGIEIFSPKGVKTAIFEVGYAGDLPMGEADALDAARAVLDDVIRVSDAGHAVFLADGTIRVRLIFKAKD